jgi:FkbM family methyltransferase
MVSTNWIDSTFWVKLDADKYNFPNAYGISLRDMDCGTVFSSFTSKKYGLKRGQVPEGFIFLKADGEPPDTFDRFRGFELSIYDLSVDDDNSRKEFYNEKYIVNGNASPVDNFKFNCWPLSYHTWAYTHGDIFYREFYKGMIEEGDIVVDAGAHIGVFSRYALTQKCSRVYSFEPNPENLEYLNLNIREFKKATIFPYAISSKSNLEIPFEINADENSQINLGESRYAGAVPLWASVPGISIDDFVKIFNIDHIDFLKLDIEGEEYPLIENSSFNNVRKIAIEYHPRNIAPTMGPLEHYDNILKKLGFSNTRGSELKYNSVILYERA